MLERGKSFFLRSAFLATAVYVLVGGFWSWFVEMNAWISSLHEYSSSYELACFVELLH